MIDQNHLTQEQFEESLSQVTARLSLMARQNGFDGPDKFENAVRKEAIAQIGNQLINSNPLAQAFPDISIGSWGIEVKFTRADSWRSVANSVLETNRDQGVSSVYIVFAKMGGEPEVKWGRYEDCIMHVRTSHVPRFEVEIDTQKPLFTQFGISYDEFRMLLMPEKMIHIRKYARSRLSKGERLWWLEDTPEGSHSLPLSVRLYTHLSLSEKLQIRAESILLCPQILKSSGARGKYDDVAMYMLTYHGVLAHQTRDLFSAGSVANPNNDDEGGIYIKRMLTLMESDLSEAALRMESALFIEYWGEDVPPEKRIAKWLSMADGFATGWTPSQELFLSNQQL